MSKSEAGFITHSRTRRDLGKRGGSRTWYISVLFHRWEEWWMDEVCCHCNGTPVYHGRGGGKRKGCVWKNKIQPLQSAPPKWIPDNIPLLCFHDKPAGLGRANMRSESWRVSGGHHMKSQWGILLFYKQVKEPASVYLTAVGFCVLKPQKPLNISSGRSMEGVLLFLFS